LAGFKKNKN